MVRNYKRVSTRASYSQEAMLAALSDVRQGKLNVSKASQQYGVPRPTIIKRLKKPGGYQPTSLGRFKPVFSLEFEEELVMHAVSMQQRFYGISVMDLRYIAYQLAERNGIEHPFSHAEKRAGVEWARSFMKRYPELSIRKPEATSLCRVSGFNRVQVGKFFDLLHYELRFKKYTAAQIYNVDETGITSVQEPGRIIAKKGTKQVGRVVSAEKGQTTTIVCAMNACGTFVPPMFLFKRKKMNAQLMTDCPPGAVGMPSDSGWMDGDLFLRYFQHFVSFVRPSEVNPVLLLLDGHQSHKSLELVDMARDNFVTILTIPPHTSHRLQPLDVSFFSPLKSAYNREVDRWMVTNPGKRVTNYDLCRIFAPAYNRVANAEKGVKGFRATGIFPFNPDVFTDEDFMPSSVTEQVDPAMHIHDQAACSGQDPKSVSVQVTKGTKPVSTKAKRRQTVSSPPLRATSSRVSVVQISPYPQVSGCNPRKRRAESSTVLTSTPNKKQLEEKANAKKKKASLVKMSKATARRLQLEDDGRQQAAAKELDQKRRRIQLKEKVSAKKKKSSLVKTTKTNADSRISSGRPKCPAARPPLPRQPIWLQEKKHSGNIQLSTVIFFTAGYNCKTV